MVTKAIALPQSQEMLLALGIKDNSHSAMLLEERDFGLWSVLLLILLALSISKIMIVYAQGGHSAQAKSVHAFQRRQVFFCFFLSPSFQILTLFL